MKEKINNEIIIILTCLLNYHKFRYDTCKLIKLSIEYHIHINELKLYARFICSSNQIEFSLRELSQYLLISGEILLELFISFKLKCNVFLQKVYFTSNRYLRLWFYYFLNNFWCVQLTLNGFASGISKIRLMNTLFTCHV